MEVFSFNANTKQLEINQGEILLVREFKTLLDRDKTKDKSKVIKELTYIWLALDWKSMYASYTEIERHEEALADSGITEKEFNDPDFRAACRKYRELQESSYSIKLLNAARVAASQFIDYFTTIVDLNERDANGKPVFDAEKVIKVVSKLNDMHEELVTLEERVKKELAEKSTVRANAIDGFDPDA